MTDLSSGPRAGSVLVSGLDCAAGLVAGLLVCLYTVSFVSILVLPVAPDFLPLALRIGLAGATIAVAVSALGPNLARVVWQSQSAVVLVLVGAAGAIEAIFSILALRDQWVPPTINLDTPDLEAGCDLDYVPNTARELPVRTAISNSFGFGGQNASLVMTRV